MMFIARIRGQRSRLTDLSICRVRGLLPIQYFIIADDRLTRKCGSVSICIGFIQTEGLFTNYSARIPLLHARAKNIYELDGGRAVRANERLSEVDRQF